AQGAVQGMSFFAASGDAGAYDCQDTNLAVDYPASDPNVTSVGGTTLTVNADGSYKSESVWSNPLDRLHGPRGAGSGGGLSSTWQMPGWQSGPGVQNSSSNGDREVPDISADADPTPGYSVYCTVSLAGCPSAGWLTVVGTSAAAPLLAASTALINQYLLSQAKLLSGWSTRCSMRSLLHSRRILRTIASALAITSTILLRAPIAWQPGWGHRMSIISPGTWSWGAYWRGIRSNELTRPLGEQPRMGMLGKATRTLVLLSLL